MPDGTRRVRPVAVNNGGARLGRAPDFACAYEVEVAPHDDRPTEQWARDAWEGASAPLRWFMWAGWRLVLGLRLDPRTSADHILGWRITERTPDETVCLLASPFLSASNTFRRDGRRLVWSTFVTYDRMIARVIWPPVSVLHRPLVRLALRRAADVPKAEGREGG